MNTLRVNSLKPLFKLTMLLAIMPPYQHSSLHQNRIYKIYRTLILIYWIFGSIYGLVDEYWYLFEYLPGTMRTMNLITYLALVLQIIVLTLSVNINNYEDFKVFFNDLIEVEKKLERKKKKNYRIYLEIILTHLVFIPIVILDCYLWFKVSDNFHFYIFHQNLQKYHTKISVHLMCNLILYMRHLFILANKTLEKSIKDPKIFIVQNENNSKELIKIFLILNKAIEFFNRIFGWTILCLNISILANILLSLNFMIQYNTKAKVLTSDYGLEFIILMSSWAVGSLIIGIFLTSVTNSIVIEAKNTSNVCYKLLSTIQDFPMSKLDENELRNDLLLLAEQIAMRSPHFTAAGFFNVDYTMLFTMLSTVTSYLVVLIQFG